MEPTYATYDPLVLAYTESGLVVDPRDTGNPVAQSIPIPPRGGLLPMRTAFGGYNGYGQVDAAYPEVYAPETAPAPTDSGWGGNILTSIGDALSNVIRTVGQQAPGMITGQPTYQPGMYPYGYPSAPLGGIPPLVLIGGVVLVGYLLMRKR